MLIIGLLAGAGLGFLYARLKSSQPDQESVINELKLEQERSLRLQEELTALNHQLREEREKVMELNGDNATLRAHYENLQTRLKEQKEQVTELQGRFADQFKNLANEIFEEKSRKFADQNKLNLDQLLGPLGQKLTEFERKVEQNSKESLKWNTSLQTELGYLRELNQKITKEAENLTKALKGDTKVQGNWGEVVLERILETSGLTKDQEYFVQESFNTEAGRRLRPDVVIRLPDNKNLVIDAKASLVAYERYINSEDETSREQALRDHLLSLRNHIKGLSEKNYSQLFESGSLDYVLMFVPIESAFALLVQQGGDLYNEAHTKNIIVVSPATLIATLRTVASIWKHEYQNRNALEIARQGGALYDKFKAFVDDLMEVGRSLDKSKEQYRLAMNKLVEGKDNLIRKTERLKELGAKTTKDMDEKLLARADASPGTVAPERKPAGVSTSPNLFG